MKLRGVDGRGGARRPARAGCARRRHRAGAARSAARCGRRPGRSHRRRPRHAERRRAGDPRGRRPDHPVCRAVDAALDRERPDQLVDHASLQRDPAPRGDLHDRPDHRQRRRADDPGGDGRLAGRSIGCRRRTGGRAAASRPGRAAHHGLPAPAPPDHGHAACRERAGGGRAVPAGARRWLRARAAREARAASGGSRRRRVPGRRVPDRPDPAQSRRDHGRARDDEHVDGFGAREPAPRLLLRRSGAPVDRPDEPAPRPGRPAASRAGKAFRLLGSRRPLHARRARGAARRDRGRSGDLDLHAARGR